MTPIAQAVRLLKEGKLVAFPTETVYGLGADATNSAAIQKIFTAKGRPTTNPLIVHIANIAAAKRYVTHWPDTAEKLAQSFWPGPLTLVLPKTHQIVPLVTAGRSTVGIRVPDHPLALELLAQFDGPLAAPSANRANHLSPTEARHVRAELGDAVDLILDGGPCAVGIESTVLDLSTAHPTILRPGGVTREQIAAIIGPVEMFTGTVDVGQAAASPGQHEKHYAPSTPAFRFERHQWMQLQSDLAAGAGQVALLILGKLESHPTIQTIEMPDEPQTYATKLYAMLRHLDAQGHARIIIEMPPDTPPWAAVRNRLERATVSI